MTKEEIKKEDLKVLLTRILELEYQALNMLNDFHMKFLIEDNYFKFRKISKSYRKEIKNILEEFDNIVDNRPGLWTYLKFVIDQFKKRLKKDIITPYPGIYIKEYLFENSIYVEDFADDLGIEEIELIALLNGNLKITEELALKLSEVIGTSSEVWINLQRDYDQAIEGDK